MLYVKATAVGIVTGVLAPVAVVIVMSIVGFLYAVAGDGIAVTGGGGGIAGVSIGLVPLMVLFIGAIGFSIGFGWTLLRARAKARG
jgi:hypothetical protein